MKPFKTFFGKLLLFGEYTVIHNAEALAMPYSGFSGRLTPSRQDDERAEKSNRSLKRLCDFIDSEKGLGDLIDLPHLKHDTTKGLWFDSNIPQGYGLGSSGALVAAVYDAYAAEEATVPSHQLRGRLAQIESCFHGSSSGLDPLVSYLNQTILVSSKGALKAVKTPVWNEDLFIFLLDTGAPRTTAELVKKYMEQYERKDFRHMINSELAKVNHAVINAFLDREMDDVLQYVQTISKLQFTHFHSMIKNMHREWQQGMESKQYYLKLCGAGGGGFILGFARSEDCIRDVFHQYQIVHSGFDHQIPSKKGKIA